MKTALDVLSRAIKAKPIRLLVIGGHAMQIYGVIRQTLDVDCLVTDKDLPDILELFKRNPSMLSKKELASLCERFGPAEIMN